MRDHKILPALAAVTFAVVAGPALAGPDWDAIERARAANKEQRASAHQRLADSDSGSVRMLQRHGPRPHYVTVAAPAEAQTIKSARAN